MSFNGSGTFVINSAGQPVVSGTVISSTAFNALTADLANGLSTCITKDGQTTPTADIPMGSNKITGLANGTAAGDAANLGQVQSTVAKLLGSVSGADTITAVGSPTVAAYAAGQMFYFVAAGANTGAVTINIDSLGAKSITRDGTTALAAGDIQSGEVCVIVYDGTQFQLVNGASQSASIVTENLTVNKATVLNESGGDNDTRIEGDTDANLFFVDASANNVGIGTSSPDYKFHVSDSGDTIAAVTAGASSVAGLNLGNSTNKADGGIRYDNATDALIFRASNAEKMRIDSSGNVGLGVTPSAWNSGYKGIDITTYGAIYSRTATNSLEILTNAYRNSSADYIYKNNGTAQYIEAANGAYSFYTAASGTAGNTITFTQAMTLDASGNLGVGTTSQDSRIHAYGSGEQYIRVGAATGTDYRGYIISGTDGDSGAYGQLRMELSGGQMQLVAGASGFGGFLTIHTNGAERARITDGGALLIGTTVAGSASKLVASESTNASEVVYFENTNASFDNRVVSINASRNTTNGTYKYLVCSISNVAAKFEILDSGTANNATGTYGTISDARLKQDIVDAPSQWNDIKSVRFRKYRMKTDVEADPDAPSMLGVVAQELEEVCPGLVADSKNEDGTTTKTVKSSILLMKAAVALQEAMTRIEELEAKVAALEAK